MIRFFLSVIFFVHSLFAMNESDPEKRTAAQQNFVAEREKFITPAEIRGHSPYINACHGADNDFMTSCSFLDWVHNSEFPKMITDNIPVCDNIVGWLEHGSKFVPIISKDFAQLHRNSFPADLFLVGASNTIDLSRKLAFEKTEKQNLQDYLKSLELVPFKDSGYYYRTGLILYSYIDEMKKDGYFAYINNFLIVKNPQNELFITIISPQTAWKALRNSNEKFIHDTDEYFSEYDGSFKGEDGEYYDCNFKDDLLVWCDNKDMSISRMMADFLKKYKRINLALSTELVSPNIDNNKRNADAIDEDISRSSKKQKSLADEFVENLEQLFNCSFIGWPGCRKIVSEYYDFIAVVNACYVDITSHFGQYSKPAKPLRKCTFESALIQFKRIKDIKEMDVSPVFRTDQFEIPSTLREPMDEMGNESNSNM